MLIAGLGNTCDRFNIKTLEHRSYQLNFWDVGGQKSLRSYWRNYFESTDGLIWVHTAHYTAVVMVCRLSTLRIGGGSKIVKLSSLFCSVKR